MQISNEIIKVFEYMSGKLGIALDWTSESILPYIQDLCDRYVIYCTVMNIITLIVGAIVTYYSAKFFTYIRTNKNFGCVFRYSDDDTISRIVLYCISIIAFIVGLDIIVIQVFDLVECATIPEKIIYEFITSEINKL